MAFGRKRKVVPFRTAGELDAMEAAGAIVGRALVAVRDAAKPGVSTLELDAVAEAVIRDAGAVPSFLGYHGFTGSICSSVNDRVVHGIPSADEVLAAGDLVSIDCGAVLDGWHVRTRSRLGEFSGCTPLYGPEIVTELSWGVEVKPSIRLSSRMLRW